MDGKAPKNLGQSVPNIHRASNLTYPTCFLATDTSYKLWFPAQDKNRIKNIYIVSVVAIVKSGLAWIIRNDGNVTLSRPQMNLASTKRTRNDYDKGAVGIFFLASSLEYFIVGVYLLYRPKIPAYFIRVCFMG